MAAPKECLRHDFCECLSISGNDLLENGGTPAKHASMRESSWESISTCAFRPQYYKLLRYYYLRYILNHE